jgi:hypothetical protein
MSTDPNEVRPWLKWLLWAFLAYIFVDQVRVRLDGYMPWDLEIYLHAARAASAGESPYTSEFVASLRFDFPFIYAPGTLTFLQPFSSLSAVQTAVGYFIAQAATLVGICRYLQQRYLPDQPMVLVVGLAVAFFPFYRDLVAGNIAIFLLAATLGTIEAAETCAAEAASAKRPTWQLGFALVLGVLGACKPFWLIPAGVVILARRSWSVLAAVTAGFAVVVGLTALRWQLVDGWVSTVLASHHSDPTVDLLRLGWPLAAAFFLAWLGLAAYLYLRRARPSSEFALTSLSVWPRLQPYSFVLGFPLYVWLIKRLGWKRAGWLIVPVCTPLTFAYSPTGGQIERWVLFVWAGLLFALAIWELWPGRSSHDRRP